ncbi:MAG: hypothetical protein NTW59_02120 [Candidatus Diapherotrites archaeon]|nr:hypothetical protein [Candidatus Diapherotrites archaeon]
MQKVVLLLLCAVLLSGAGHALTVDMNSFGIVSSSGGAGSSDYNINISVGQQAVGTASSANYVTYMGFYFGSSDTTAPEVTILSPTQSVTTGNTVTFSFIGTDDASAIAKYWVKIDSGNWIDNGTATTYTFSIGSGQVLPVEHTFYVKATNDAVPDLNSAVASKTLRFESATSGAGGPGAGAAPGGATEALEPIEIFNAIRTFTPLAEPSIPVLDQTVQGVDLQKKRFAAPDELLINRRINVFALMGAGGVSSYWHKVFIEVWNIGSAPLFGLEVIEGIGKEIVASAAEIHSSDSFEVIEPDPVLRFFVGDMQPGEKKTVSYDFNRSPEQGPVTQEMFNKMGSPTALVVLQPGDACLGVYCNDSNPCTRDYCSKGECVFAPMNEGAKCMEGRVCQRGVCAAAPMPTPGITLPTTQVTPLEYAAIIALAGAVTLGVAWQFTVGKWRKRRPRIGG